VLSGKGPYRLIRPFACDTQPVPVPDATNVRVVKRHKWFGCLWIQLNTPKGSKKDTNQHPTTPGPGNRRSSTRAEVQLLNIKLMNGDGRESSENT